MKIAYLVLAHKNPEQVKRLVRLLSGDVYVHIDIKCDSDEFYINNPKIKYISQRVSINWGGFSMVNATLNLINAAREKFKYDYYVLLSGDDYPIRNVNELELFLIKHREQSFIEYDKFEDKWQHLMPRYKTFNVFEKRYFIYRVLQKILNVFVKKRGMYNSLQAYKGSQWWCLNSESIEYVLKYIKDNKNIVRYFKHTHIPDEMFFQIILMNSHLKDTMVNDNLRYILLGDQTHPEILTTGNFNELINLEGKFLARKFDTGVDSKILDLLDSEYNQ